MEHCNKGITITNKNINKIFRNLRRALERNIGEPMVLIDKGKVKYIK